MKIRITDIHEEDAFYKDKEKYIGTLFKVDRISATNGLNLGIEGWSYVRGQSEVSEECTCFYAIKYEEIEDEKE